MILNACLIMSCHCISGVFGTLELYGQPHSVYHTKLAATATAGSNTLTLAHAVDWNVSTSLFRQNHKYRLYPDFHAVILSICMHRLMNDNYFLHIIFKYAFCTSDSFVSKSILHLFFVFLLFCCSCRSEMQSPSLPQATVRGRQKNAGSLMCQLTAVS